MVNMSPGDTLPTSKLHKYVSSGDTFGEIMPSNMSPRETFRAKRYQISINLSPRETSCKFFDKNKII